MFVAARCLRCGISTSRKGLLLKRWVTENDSLKNLRSVASHTFRTEAATSFKIHPGSSSLQELQVTTSRRKFFSTSQYSGVRDSALSVQSSWEEQPEEFESDDQLDEEFYVEKHPEVYVPVEAVFLAQAVDLKTMAADKSLDATLARNHCIIKQKHPAATLEPSQETGVPTIDCWNTDRYMVIFNYGTVVLFNFVSGNEEEVLKIVKQHCKGVFEEPTRDNYCVVVKPTLEKWSKGSLDRIMVKELDMNSIRTVAVILSQSIALDRYTKKIDSMLKSFDDLNLNMQQTGTFNLKRKELFKLVASVNTALAEAILKVGLLERSDVAWQNAKYDSIWEFMREEFELEDRFESLEFKTGIIQHNVAFYLDILQNRKSDSLEWIIIILIAADMCVSLYQIFLGS